MKIKKLAMPLIMIATLFSCLCVYWFLPQGTRWMITSVVDVPICTARVANKLGIQHNFASVKSYILESVEIGMTPEQVEKALSEIGSIEIGKTFIDEERVP